MSKSLKILVISSVNPYQFGNLALDRMKSLQQKGHKVDFLTLNGFNGQKQNMYSVFDRTMNQKIVDSISSNAILRRIKRFFLPDLRIKNTRVKNKNIEKDGLVLVNYDERVSPCDENMLLSSIRKEYDLIITIVWEHMISAKTLISLFNKCNCPIVISPVDMFPFTGGCRYFGKCTRYMQGCGKCPIIGSDDSEDQTSINYKYKKKVYEKIPCALVTNSYMMNIANRTGMFRDAVKIKNVYSIDKTIFKPMDVLRSRLFFHIPSEMKYVIFARYCSPSDNPRKGLDILKKAIISFCNRISKDELSSICIVFAGMDCSEIESFLPIRVFNLRRLSINELIMAYSAASVFLSPSVDDAGPSMVNQSIMCGTPVVCFDIGTAIDVIKHKENGYKASLGDVDDFVHGMLHFYNMSNFEYLKIRKQTRDIAVELQSLEKYVSNIELAYEKILERRGGEINIGSVSTC